MTLDEAIIHCEEVVKQHENKKALTAVTLEACRCADDHRQLVEWLNELKELREKFNRSETSNSSELTTKQAAIDAIYNAFCYAYCDNCENSAKDDDSCDDCHRKYQNWRASKKVIEKVINGLPSVEPEQCGDSDKIYAIMKDYYFEHKDEHDASWQAGFGKCMNLIPNVFDKVGR